MEPETFKYAVLQYVPSQVLNERVNVGIVLFFLQSGKVRFIFPTHLGRLRSLFHKVQEKKIRIYLEQTAKNVAKLNKRDLLFYTDFRNTNDRVSFLDTEILKDDDSSLQFSTVYESIRYSDSDEKIVNDLYREYFSEYVQKPGVNNITEVELRKSFEKSLRTISPGVLSKFQKDYKIAADNNEFIFDYAWQNGSLNLVKPVSFDLQEVKKIQEKSVLLYGNLSLLSEEAQRLNYKFDLIVAKPQRPAVFKSFDNAIKTIDKANVNHEIIYSDQIEGYARKAIDYIEI